MASREFQGGLYYDEVEGRPALPAELLEAVIRAGATKKRKGKAVVAGIEVEGDMVPLEYEGPRDRAELFTYEVNGERVFVDRRMVRVPGSGGKVPRTRPRFNVPWALEFTIRIIPGASVGPEDVRAALVEAGQFKGIGDYLPRFGLFKLARFEEQGAARAA